MPSTQRCIIRGHDHDLIPLYQINQSGTSSVMIIYECPSGAYRFHSVDGRPVSREGMYTRPRYGWRKQQWYEKKL